MNGMPAIAPVIKRNIWNALLAFTAVVSASYAYLKMTPPVYEGSVRLILDDQRLSVSELGQAIAANPAPGNANPIATQAELIASEGVLKQAALLLSTSGLGEKAPEPGEIASALKVKIVPATNILEVYYTNRDPKVVAAVLNAISQATVQESGESIRQQASSVRQFVEARVPRQQEMLERAELAESQFKEANGIVALDDQDKNLVNSLSVVEDQERTLSAELSEAQKKTGQLQSIIGVNNVQTAYITSRAGQDEELKALRGKLTDLEAQVIDARSRLGDQNPELLALEQKRDETRAFYSQSLARVVPNSSSVPSKSLATDDLSRGLIATYITGSVEQNALLEKLRALQSQQEPLRARLASLPAKQRVLSSLDRKREQEALTLKMLQSKLEEARIAEAQLISNVRVVGQASVPSTPANPKPAAALVLGLAAGLASAIGVILLGELLNTKVGSSSEVEDQLKLPVLGILPRRLPLQPSQLNGFLNNSAAVEPYRRILKTLELSNKDSLKSILVSSSIAGEGKSSVAAHLAIVAAMMSRRTLLIDADLSHPLQHHFFGLSQQPGLTDVVSESAPLNTIVQPTTIANLSVLTQGKWFNRPAQVLEADAMKALMQTVVNDYDLVIIDTSPVTRFADAMTLSEHTDGVVLVVRPEFTPKAAALQSIADLERSGAKILGAIVNPTPDPSRVNRSPSSPSPEVADRPLPHPSSLPSSI